LCASADSECPQILLGAENNTEKSGCLAQTGKKFCNVDAIRPYFSGPSVLERAFAL
jgi:hypothetical protein